MGFIQSGEIFLFAEPGDGVQRPERFGVRDLLQLCSDCRIFSVAQQAQGGLQQIGNAVTSSAITMIMNAARQFENKQS